MAARLNDCVAFQRPIGQVKEVIRVDPFEMEDEMFRKKYRFSKQSVNNIMEILRNDIDSISPTNNCLSIEERILLALRFYSTGGYQSLIGDTLQRSQSSVCRHVKKVTESICKLAPKFIAFPTDQQSLRSISNAFFNMKGFPKVVGAIDGTQIGIKAPSLTPEQYINRHGTPAINVQAVCNHRGAFTNLVARWPGSTHDSRILKESRLWRMLDNCYLGDYVLLGDSGFGCSRHMMTPYGNPVQDCQIYYNTIHAKTRVRIECVFGMWKRRFGCLTKVLQLEPAYACKVVTACAILWNLGLLLGDTKGYETDTVTEPERDVVQNKEPTSTGVMIRSESTQSLWRRR